MAKTAILGGAHITQAMSDSKFLALMPEFRSVKVQQDTMRVDLNSKKGCNSCNKRRYHANIDSNFAVIASELHPARAAVLKQYLGVDKLLIRAINPATRQPFTKEV